MQKYFSINVYDMHLKVTIKCNVLFDMSFIKKMIIPNQPHNPYSLPLSK